MPLAKSVRYLGEMQARQIECYKAGKNVWFILPDIESYRGAWAAATWPEGAIL